MLAFFRLTMVRLASIRLAGSSHILRWLGVRVCPKKIAWLSKTLGKKYEIMLKVDSSSMEAYA